MRKTLMAALAAVSATALMAPVAYAQRDGEGRGRFERQQDGDRRERQNRDDGERRGPGGQDFSRQNAPQQAAPPQVQAPPQMPAPQARRDWQPPPQGDFSARNRGSRDQGALAGGPQGPRDPGAGWRGRAPTQNPQSIPTPAIRDARNSQGQRGGGDWNRQGDSQRRADNNTWNQNGGRGGDWNGRRDGGGNWNGDNQNRQGDRNRDGRRDGGGDWNRDNQNRQGDWNRDGRRDGGGDWNRDGRRDGDWNRDGRRDGDGDWNRDGRRDGGGDWNRDGRRDGDWNRDGRNRSGDWNRDGRHRDWRRDDNGRDWRDWNWRRDDNRYRSYRHTHRDFDYPRYRDWRGVRHGHYFDYGYSRIVSLFFGWNYYWWDYPSWRRPYRDYRVGYYLPDWIYWEPVPWDLYYRLPPPPYGCRYIMVDRDILLISLATGIVLDALMYY